MTLGKEIIFEIIAYGSDAYKKSVSLREEVLRKPLGLSFSPEELEKEKEHIHIAGYLGKELCATAVLIPEGNQCKMQRVATKSHLQNKGIGSALMIFCEAYAKKQGFESIYCHASATIPFYLKNKYTLEGLSFDEDGIPHQKMRKCL